MKYFSGLVKVRAPITPKVSGFFKKQNTNGKGTAAFASRVLFPMNR